MNDLLNSMVNCKSPRDVKERDHATREAVQELILYGLAKTDFFEKAVFTGGTALRIFYDLDRFSEDLDFVLKEPIPDFDLKKYLDNVQEILSKYNIKFIVKMKDKVIDNNIKTGMMSVSTRELVLSFFSDDDLAKGIYETELTRIKIDVDIEPALFIRYETKEQTMPEKYSASVFDLSTMLSGKIHAILCRGWKNRVKGRDLFDFIFLVDKGIECNFDYLKHKLMKSGFDGKDITPDKVKDMLMKKFTELDYASAIDDVTVFIGKDVAKGIKEWGPELFVHECNRLKI